MRNISIVILCIAVYILSSVGINHIHRTAALKNSNSKTNLTQIRKKLDEAGSKLPNWVWKSPNENGTYIIKGASDGVMIGITFDAVFIKFPDGYTLISDRWGSLEFDDGKESMSPEGERRFSDALRSLLMRLNSF